ncbi:MAG: CBM21 domain-containing protein [Oscillospiraceae bacterium]|jgi:hypothetical protein|nr:CBM21 domain-containing protein [Oscillospiraceae bacterium]
MTKTTKKRRITAIAIVLTLILSMFAMMPTASAVTDEVSLIYATFGDGGGPPVTSCSWILTKGYIEVENLAYDKEVIVHYTTGGGVWQEAEASYFAPTWGNKEAWYFETASYSRYYQASYYCEFAIEYKVNGYSYWDNNGGNNYQISFPMGPPVYLANFTFGATKVVNALNNTYLGGRPSSVTIVLENVAYNKIVKVRYTTDDWATYSEVDATFQEGSQSYNNEIWYASLAGTGATEYAISYTVNGVTYWDNNFGQNYGYPS